MRHSIAVLLIPMAAVLGCTATDTGDVSMKASADPEVRLAIEAANAGMAEAMLAGDAARFATYYDAEGIALPPGAAAAHGPAAIQEAIAGMLGEVSVSSFSLTTGEVQVAGDLAVEVGNWTMTMQPKAAGAPAQTDNGKYVVIWKLQEDGSWKMLRDIWNSDNPPPAAPAAH